MPGDVGSIPTLVKYFWVFYVSWKYKSVIVSSLVCIVQAMPSLVPDPCLNCVRLSRIYKTATGFEVAFFKNGSNDFNGLFFIKTYMAEQPLQCQLTIKDRKSRKTLTTFRD